MAVKNSIYSKPSLPQSVGTPQVSLLKSHKQSVIGTLVPCNKKRRVTKNGVQEEECSLLNRHWENLDSNILRIIYSRLSVQDLFLNVSSVCLSWEAACWDYLFWGRNVLDLSIRGTTGLGVYDMSDVVSLVKFESKPMPGIFTPSSDSPEKYNDMATSLMRKLSAILEGQSIQGWTNSIETIILPYDLEISDAHLLYIAERTPRIQQLILLCPRKITASGFSRAIQNWKHVKEVHIGSHEDYALMNNILVEIGKNCKELEILHIHKRKFKVGEASAPVIAKSMPGLKKLEVELGDMRPSGVVAFFEACLQLEEIEFSRCELRNDREMSDLPEADPNDLELAKFEQNEVNSRPHSFRLGWFLEDKGKWHVEPKKQTLEEIKETLEGDEDELGFTAEDMFQIYSSESYDAEIIAGVVKWLAYSMFFVKRPSTCDQGKMPKCKSPISREMLNLVRSQLKRVALTDYIC